MYSFWAIEIQVRIDSKQISSQYTNSQFLNDSLLNDGWVKEEIKKNKKKSKCFLELNENENKTAGHVVLHNKKERKTKQNQKEHK